jgi:ABC-type bacteriocin/lantibiotic exporter with double-glycine peptidase domain
MSNTLPVPHRQQLADGYCLPACIQMVLAYWGIEQDQSDLARQLQMVAKAGTPGSHVHLLASATLEVTYRSGELADLRAALDQGVPPIMLVYTGELPYWDQATAHAVVLVGIEGGSAVLNDPGMRQAAAQVPLDDLLLAWDEMANLFALLRPKTSPTYETDEAL